MKLVPKKNGKGYVTSYTLNIGSAEARLAGFLNEKAMPLEVEKIIDKENKRITFKLKQEDS